MNQNGCVRVLTLMENTARDDALCRGHGLSLYIETPKHRILFDMGPDGESLLKNAETLGVDLARGDVAVLSHGHYDHGGGLAAFLSVNQAAPVYVRENAFAGYFHVEGDEARYIGLDESLKASDRIVFTGESLRIDEELLLYAEVPSEFDVSGSSALLRQRTPLGFQPDGFTHEQNLLITVPGRAVLVSGCAHRGIVNILSAARERLGRMPDATFGGFHLFQLEAGSPASDRVLEQTARALLPGTTVYHTGHCTGADAFEKLRAVLGERLRGIFGGAVYEI